MRYLEISEGSINRIAELNRELRSLDPEPAEGESPFMSLSDILGDKDQVEKYLAKRMELAETMAELPLNQLQELEAITWIGRGDFATFDDALGHSKTFGNDERGNVVYLVAKPLCEYLSDGLIRLREEGILLAD